MQLTPEQLKQNAAAMIAFADGKPVEWMNYQGEWEESTSLAGIQFFRFRPKPWTLPEPPKGKQWHRANEWTENMLPEGYRPLLDGEVAQIGDEYYFIDEWFSHKEDGKPITSEKSKAGGAIWCLHRTRRPLPTEPKTRPWSKPDDVPGPVCWLRPKVNQPAIDALIVGIRTTGVFVHGNREEGWRSWEQLAEMEVEYSIDRKTWAKCEVTE